MIKIIKNYLKKMSSQIKSTIFLGFIDSHDSSCKMIRDASDFFQNGLSSTTIKSIKIWFGPTIKKPSIKALLGLEVTYINYKTREKKNDRISGAADRRGRC